MKFELDPEANALYLRLRAGRVHRTVEFAPDVYLDVDPADNVLGAEFVHADDFLTLVRQHDGGLEIPEQVKDRASA